MLEYEKAKQKLEKYNQEQLLQFYEALTDSEKEKLVKKILEMDLETIKELYESKKKTININDEIEPIEYIDKEKLSKEEKEKYEKIGAKIISNGQYAVAMMAGGQRNKTWTYWTKRYVLLIRKQISF